MATLAGKEHQPPWCASAAKGTLHVLALLPQPVQPTKEEGFCRTLDSNDLHLAIPNT